MLGDPASDELHALKRVSFGAQTSVALSFQAAASLPGLTLYLMCDSYLGMDQQYPIPLRSPNADRKALASEHEPQVRLTTTAMCRCINPKPYPSSIAAISTRRPQGACIGA